MIAGCPEAIVKEYQTLDEARAAIIDFFDMLANVE
jgi:hypothetical protein